MSFVSSFLPHEVHCGMQYKAVICKGLFVCLSLVCLQMQEQIAFVVLLMVYCSDETYRLFYYKCRQEEPSAVRSK